jgi:hypothetical protein
MAAPISNAIAAYANAGRIGGAGAGMAPGAEASGGGFGRHGCSFVGWNLTTAWSERGWRFW